VDRGEAVSRPRTGDDAGAPAGYFHNDVGFEKQPNRLLVDAVAKRKPGRALDVAMGQGRNALYLASRGWKVTGVNFSDEGVRAASLVRFVARRR
jgi:2-polyprenyl-3-methyl-5-hydroxy-6-metoxy-1,4-benzoquinol methylase